MVCCYLSSSNKLYQYLKKRWCLNRELILHLKTSNIIMITLLLTYYINYCFKWKAQNRILHVCVWICEWAVHFTATIVVWNQKLKKTQKKYPWELKTQSMKTEHTTKFGKQESMGGENAKIITLSHNLEHCDSSLAQWLLVFLKWVHNLTQVYTTECLDI